MKYLTFALLLCSTSLHAMAYHRSTSSFYTQVPATALVANPDGSWVAYQNKDGYVLVHRTIPGNLVNIGYSIVPPIFTPDGQHVVISDKKSIKHYSFVTNKFEQVYPRPQTPMKELRYSPTKQLQNIAPERANMWVSPDGSYKVRRNAEKKLVVGKAEGEKSITLGTSISRPVFTPDGSKMIYTDGNSFTIYTFAQQKVARRRLNSPITDIQISPDGSALLFYKAQEKLGTMYLYYFAQRKIVALRAMKPVTMATFGSPDIVVAATEKYIQIWHLDRFVPSELAPREFRPIIPVAGEGETTPPPVAPKRRRVGTYSDPRDVYKDTPKE